MATPKEPSGFKKALHRFSRGLFFNSAIKHYKAQKEAVNISYDALRYITNPSYNTEIIAVKNNEAAIKFISNLDKDKIINFIKANILVLRYISKSSLKEISNEEIHRGKKHKPAPQQGPKKVYLK